MLTIRCDEAEHELFKAAAAAACVSISVFARDAMLARMALEEGVGGSVRGRGLDGGGSAADAGGDDQQSTERQQVGSIPAPPVDPFVRPRGARRDCRHGHQDCRVCRTGRFVE